MAKSKQTDGEGTPPVNSPSSNGANGLLLAGNFTLYRPTSRTRPSCGEKIICPTRSAPVMLTSAVEGGTPIDNKLARELTKSVFGIMSHSSRTPWMTSGFVFRDPATSLPFGLVAHKSETKGFVMCIQTYLLKNLLFCSKALPSVQTRSSGHVGLFQLNPKRTAPVLTADQDELLAIALSDILWKIGRNVSDEHQSFAFVCLPQANVYLTDDAEFTTDGLTERIHIFEFVQFDNLQNFLRRYLYILQESGGPGCLLFLYSVVLTKGFAKLKSEMDDSLEHLLLPRGECSQALINLMLTARASPFTHNGSCIYDCDDDENSQGKTKIGILERSEIGLLIWHHSDPSGSLVGSRLKTPRLPIWLTKTTGHYGVLFNNSLELTRDYHAERQFDMFYYSSNRCQNDVTRLSIDTKVFRGKKDDHDVPILERLILTNDSGPGNVCPCSQPCRKMARCSDILEWFDAFHMITIRPRSSH